MKISRDALLLACASVLAAYGVFADYDGTALFVSVLVTGVIWIALAGWAGGFPLGRIRGKMRHAGHVSLAGCFTFLAIAVMGIHETLSLPVVVYAVAAGLMAARVFTTMYGKKDGAPARAKTTGSPEVC